MSCAQNTTIRQSGACRYGNARRAALWAALMFCASAAAETVTIGFAVDNDKDGVEDTVDQCLYSPPGAVVDVHGCSPDNDQDADGVKDDRDDCPYSPPGVVVDARGCAIDTDYDGIADGLDRCEGTGLGDLVDRYGCASQQTPGVKAEAAEPKPSEPAPAPRAEAPAAEPAVAPVLKPQTPPNAVSSGMKPPATAPAGNAATAPAAVLPPPPKPVEKAPPQPAPAPAPRSEPTHPQETVPKPSASSEPPPKDLHPAPVPTVSAPVPTATNAAQANSSLLTLYFVSGNGWLAKERVEELKAKIPMLQDRLRSSPHAQLLVKGFADTAEGANANTIARTRANVVRKLLAENGIDARLLSSVGLPAQAAAPGQKADAQSRVDVVLEVD